MVSDVMFSSAREDWATPQWLYDELDAEFHFRLDAAADETNAKHKWYWSKDGLRKQGVPDVLMEGDGLTGGWCSDGWTFVNPPYGRGITGKWVEKAVVEAHYDRPSVLLLPARTDTRYFHHCIWDKASHRPYANTEVRFLPGRLKFEVDGKPMLDKDGKPMGAPFPSMVVVFKA
jgi:phage N-6-adenine-methyltransferase